MSNARRICGVITTFRAAAGVAGVTVSTLQRWVESGHLASGPWSHAQIKTAAAARKPTRPRGVEHGTAECWRAGCARPECLAAHNADARRRRKRRRVEKFSLAARQTVLDEVAGGASVSEAAEGVNLGVFDIFGAARAEPEFREALDDALMTGRDPTLDHGRARLYSKGMCKCPECRRAHTGTA